MSDISFDPKKVAFAVVTSYPKWYRGKLRSIKHTQKVRGDLALEFAQKVTEAGYHLVIADSRSTKTFVKTLKESSKAFLIKRKMLGSGVGKRMAIDKAVSILVVTACMEQIVQPILQNKAEIVVPRRNDDLFKSTYPRYMYESEVEANSIYNEALYSNSIMEKTQPPLDWCFGPRAFRNDKNILALFKRVYIFSGISLLEKLYTPDTYSNVQFFPVITALKKKFRVLDKEVPFRYPHLQKENEDIGDREYFIEKRSLQRVSILIDLMHFLSYLEKRKSSKLRAET
jgi:hypothetical protein